MDLKMKCAILLLVSMKTINCKDCTFSYDPSNHCNLSILCEGTSDIANIAASRRNYDCPSWKRRATFSDSRNCIDYSNPNSIEKNYTISCSSCENSVVFGSFVEFSVINSDCRYLSMKHFAKFPNLEVFRMQNTNLEEVTIDSQTFGKVYWLDLSQNKILNMYTSALLKQRNLQMLNVSYNVIYSLTNEIFRNLPSLKVLDLTSNRIEKITPMTFYGLNNLKILYLSHNTISDINSAFDDLMSLEEIYLDHNTLQEINGNYFKSLEKLKILKLNSNNINVIDWAVMEYIPMIKVFDISNNAVKMVGKNVFAKNTYLNYVDFSYNKITQLIPKTFLKKNITHFAMKNNLLKGSLDIGMFEGMAMVTELDLSHQYIDAVGDHAFYGLTRLTTLLLNDNLIQNITKKAFDSLEELEILDLSNNMLHYIDFEYNEFKKLKSLQLKNNLIADIGKNSFTEMHSLEILDVSRNNLVTFNRDIYEPILPHLKQLNISHNSLKIIQGDIFNKLVHLTWIDLSYNSNLTIAYNPNKNTSLEKQVDLPQAFELKSVGMSNCDMDSVNILELNTFKNITIIYLFHNHILKIEYGMFSSNKELIQLDLSYNKISHIQPGSFKDNNKLKVLNVAHNELLELEYGSFRGLKLLSYLDISFNKIKSLKNGRFFDTSSLNTLIADNNTIESVDYEDFAGANITTLSIGGNPIPCLVLVNLKTETHSLQVTAMKEELHSPNYKGVSCKNDNQGSMITDYMLIERRDALLEDIRNILLEIKSANHSKPSPDSESDNVSTFAESINRKFYRNEADIETNVAKPVQPSQTVLSILSDICLMFISVVILCLILYKLYKINLFSSLRRGRSTASTQHTNESIATATLVKVEYDSVL